MWVTSLTPIRPYFPAPILKLTKHQALTHFPINVSANSHLSRQPDASNGGNNPKQEEGSGSDVLWALQRAASQKEKANRKKELASSDASHREKDCLDYRHSNVTPFEIKNEWRLKLDELEKRLQELE